MAGRNYLFALLLTLVAAPAFAQTLASMSSSPATARITSGTQTFTITCKSTAGMTMACPSLTCASRFAAVATVTNSGSSCVATAVANGTAPLAVYASGSHTGAAAGGSGDDTVGNTMLLTVASSAPTYAISTTPTHQSYSLPSQPAKGASYTEQLGTAAATVTRVTNSSSDTTGVFSTITEYATFSMRSADGQYLMVEPCASANAYQSNSGGACSPQMEIYNAATLNWIVATTNLLSWNGSAPEPRWNSASLSGVGSGVHAFTYRKNTQLREYNVDTQADVLIFDFCTFITNAYIAGWGDSNTCAVNPTAGYTVLMNEYGSWSDSGQYIALIVKWSANNDEPMVLVYDRVGNAVYSSLDIHACIAATICPKGILISPSGGYVVVNYFFSSVPTSCTPASTQGGQIAYTKNFTTACIQVGSDPEHINFGYDNQGNEVAWAFSQQQYLNFIVLSTGKTYELYDWSTIQYPGVLFPQRGPNGWGFLQTYTLCTSSYNCTLIASGSATTWASESTMGSGRIAAVEMDETKCKWFFNSYHDEYNSSGAGTGGTACGTLPRVWQIASTNNDYLAPPISPFTNQPWSSSTSYLVDDVVTSGGTGYLALVANTNVTPSGNPSTWQAISTDTSGSGYFMQINFQYDPTSTYLGWFGSNWLNGNSNPAEVYQLALPVNWTSDLGGGGNGPLGNVPGRQPRL
jgi:hypothetical protein